MPTDLYEQLAAELGTSPAEAEDALRDLLHDVKERAEAGEDVSLPQLGTFSMDEGTLRFTPSPHLQKAVNYRNNHLASLTVRAPSDAPPSPSNEPDPPPEEAPPPEDASPPADEAFAPVEPSPSLKETPPPDTDDEAADETPADDTETVAPLSEDWTEELDEDAPSSPDEKQDATASPAASMGQIAGLAAAMAGLVLLIWFVLGLQGIVTGPGALFDADEQAAPASADTAATAGAAADTASPDASSSDTNASSLDTAEPQAPSESPTTPPTIDRASGGWTIVVTSRTRPGEAKAVYEAYQQRFLGSDVPVDILTGSSGGRVRYRVTVGQYASREAALTAQQDLQDRLPNDAWILRIQPNS